MYDGHTPTVTAINGNLTKDENKGISLIEYNRLNLPDKITFDGGRRFI